MKDYIEYVEEQITFFKENSKLLDGGSEITPVALNRALAQFSGVNAALNGEYQRRKYELEQLQNRFNIWWDEKFVQVRREMNPIDIPGSKWASLKEIEAEVRVQNKSKFLEWREALLSKEMSVAFIKRLLDQWADHGKMLMTLSTNMRNEMKSIRFEGEIESSDNAQEGKRTQFPSLEEIKTRVRRRPATNST